MDRAVDIDDTNLTSDEWTSFMAIGKKFVAHDAVRHSTEEYARCIVHANGAEVVERLTCRVSCRLYRSRLSERSRRQIGTSRWGRASPPSRRSV